jgi:hypothetical protein
MFILPLFILLVLLGVNLLGKYGAQFGIERSMQKKIGLFVVSGLLVFLLYLFWYNLSELFVSLCVVITIYIIYRSAAKSKAHQSSPGKTHKDEHLIISIHLDGGNESEGGETLEVTKGLMIYQISDTGSKVIANEWDYDFWQITSNRSNRSFEWIREDQNANYDPTLRFWEGGNEHELRENISEDMAIDIILDSYWIRIPEMDNNMAGEEEEEKELAMEDAEMIDSPEDYEDWKD